MRLHGLTVWVLREGTQWQFVAGGLLAAASQLRIEALFSVGAAAIRAPNGHENQGRPKRKAACFSHISGHYLNSAIGSTSGNDLA
jgi:hypothetical protein